ncbi:MAG: hypothetical protein K6F14_04885, partial [Clostridiales bacterium]|nr:hypothetical protein [Clostridiales bacterium]
KRILEPEFSSEAASLLYGIKGARDAKMGKIGIDDIGLVAISKNILEIRFEEGVDVDEFLYNLASPALVPLRENKVTQYEDTWSKTSTDLSTNGAFKVKKFSSNATEVIILERNKYYYRNWTLSSEILDKYVTPYKIYIHYDATLDSDVVYAKEENEDVKTMFINNELFYVSNLTNETEGAYSSKVLKTNELASTYSYYFNTKLSMFSNPQVRYALSIALDRSAMADAVGCGAKAATGLIPSMVFDTKKGTSFRKVGGDLLSTSSNLDEARSILSQQGIDPSKQDTIYLYYLTDAVNDSYYSAQLGFESKEKRLGDLAKEAWEQLGFKVVTKGMTASELYTIYLTGDFDVIGLDVQMLTAYAFGTLAQFATGFSGSVKLVEAGSPDYDESLGLTRYYVNNPHATGYSDSDYDSLIEQAYAAATQKDKAALLHEAEEKLIKDGVVAPVIFNAERYAVSDKLSGITINYFGTKILTKAELKDYLNYLH